MAKLNNSQITNSIEKIVTYYLSGKTLPSRYREIAQQFFLLLVSVSGASLYAVPANEYAKKHGSSLAGDALLSRQLNYILCTCIPSLGVLYNATDIFLTIRRRESVPAELNEFLTQAVSGTQRKIQDAIVIIGSAISAIPLMMVGFAYPLPIAQESIVLKIIQCAVVEFDNTILHFLPLKLAMQYKIYRIPILPFEFLVNKLREKKPVQVNKEAEALKESMVNFIQYIQRSLLVNKSSLIGFFSYGWTFDTNIKDVLDGQIAESFLKKLVEEFPVNSALPGAFRSKLSSALEMVVRVMGAVWVTTSGSGYLLGPVKQIYAWTGDKVLTGLISAPALYFLTVLLSFFGDDFGRRLYGFFTNWSQDEPKLPLEFKLYPKAFTLLMIVNVYIMFYSYAAAEELVLDNFADSMWDPVRPLLIWLSRTGISFLGLSAMKDLSQTLLRKLAVQFGTGDTRFVARFMSSLEDLEYAIRTTNPEVFAENATALETIGISPRVETPSQIAFEGVVTEESPLLNESAQESNEGRRQKSKWCCFNWRVDNTVEEEDVLEAAPLEEENKYFGCTII